MYENMMEELKNLANQVDAWETESNEAVKNLETEVQNAFADKEKHIAEFIAQMVEVIKTANIPTGREIQLSCCGDHWEGIPGGCGSHRRSIGLCFRRNYDRETVKVWFGRWFIGSGCIDKILNVTREGLAQYSDGTYGNIRYIAPSLRDNILSRWNEHTEEAIVKQIFAKCKAELAKRTQNATEKLKTANERYNEFCKGV